MIFFKKKNNEKLFLGIDLGTTYSLLATIKKEKVIFLLDNKKRYLLPSVVCYKKDNTLVGWDALDNVVNDPINTITSVKRLLGRSIDFIKKEFPILPYLIDEDKNGSIFFHTRAGILTPIDVSSHILAFLKKRAIFLFKKEIDASIITVPAYFDNIQKNSIKKAALLAKINLIRLLNEPTAAAIAYGLQKQKKGIIIVYDLGGGTFDVSILKLNKDIFEVLATSGDSHLGGDDFDYALADYITKKSNLLDACNESLYSLLLQIAKETKIKLSKFNKVKVEFLNWQGYITRDEFNSIIIHSIRKTLHICSEILQEVNLSIDKIEQVILVGGSTRIPLVFEEVSIFFQQLPLCSINPDQVVAIGAAMQVNMLSNKNIKNKTILLDIMPLSLGIEVMGGFVEKIILKNTSIPISKTKEFTTYKDNQTSILIHILQGERELVKDCISLSRFVLKNIKPQKAGLTRILVTFQVDADGLINVHALEKNSNKEKSIQIDRSFILKKINTHKKNEKSLKSTNEDHYTRFKIEKKMEAIRILEILNNALIQDKHLISENELEKIKSKKKNLENSINQDDFFSIKIKLKELENASKNFFDLRLKKAMYNFSKTNDLKEIT